jgi:hypothetical protein
MRRTKVWRQMKQLWRKTWLWFMTLRWEIKIPLGLSVFATVVLLALWTVSSLVSFIRPAVMMQSVLYLGSTSSYCTYWARTHEQIGKPTAGPCGVVLVGVNISPSDSMPFAGDAYAPGNCTYWAALRRGQTNEAIPNNWGDAYMWAAQAAGDGYVVDHTPTTGAVMQTSAGALGHVAFVESVDADGTWHISEMNVEGLGVVDYRALPPSAAADYYFIH